MTATLKPDVRAVRHGQLHIDAFHVDPTPTLARVTPLLSAALGSTPYYAHSGTALGFHRDGGWMAHDTDIDFAVHLSWYGKPVLPLVDVFADYGLRLVQAIWADRKPSQFVFADSNNDNVLVDVEVYYDDVVDGSVVHYKPQGFVEIPAWLVDSAMSRRYYGVAVPMPDRIEGYLEARYGPEWQTPLSVKTPFEDYTPAFTAWRK